MLMKKLMFTVLSLMAFGSTGAQVYLLEGKNYQATGVSNDGVAVGFTYFTGPYSMWNPLTGEYKDIGGVAEGDGFGGRARLSADGSLVAGTMMAPMDVSAAWQAYPHKGKDYTISSFGFPYSSSHIAVGYVTNNPEKGVVLKSSDGRAWTEMGNECFSDMPSGKVNGIFFLNDVTGFMCGDGGYFMYTMSQGKWWEKSNPKPASFEGNVDDYTSILGFTESPFPIVVGVRLADGSGAVFQSPDGSETWTETSGVKGVPVHFSVKGTVLWMVTENGYIQKSIDLGKTWTEVFHTDKPLRKVYVNNYGGSSGGVAGIALSDGTIFRSMDEGKTWNEIAVMPGITDGVQWNDLYWTGQSTAILIGSDGSCYSTEDRGYSWLTMGLQTTSNLTAIGTFEGVTDMAGTGGEFFQLLDEVPEVSQIGLYNVGADSWQPLGTLGYWSDNIAGSGLCISGDGNVVVGTNQVQDKKGIGAFGFVHGSAWSRKTGMMDLGGMYDDICRSSRANWTNYDGSVVVGWQDQGGPWHGVVWRRADDGTYSAPQYILKDPSKGAEDFTNRAGEAWCVSPDGKWIGGLGQNAAVSAVDGPWIWSEETGLEELRPGYGGYVTGIRNDRSVIVGNNTPLGAFIITEEKGFQSLDDYVTEKYGIELGDVTLFSVLAMSDNGRYVAGWAGRPMKNNPSQIDVLGMVVDLEYESTSVDGVVEEKQCSASVYPNPASEELHVDLFYDNVDTKITLVNLGGHVVKSCVTTDNTNVIPLTDVAPGMYIVNVSTNGFNKSFKIIVK